MVDINESSIWEMVLRAAASSVTKKAAARGTFSRPQRPDTEIGSVASRRSASSGASVSASSHASKSTVSSFAASLTASWSSLTRAKSKAAKRGPALDSGPSRLEPLADLPEDAPCAAADTHRDQTMSPAGEACASQVGVDDAGLKADAVGAVTVGALSTDESKTARSHASKSGGCPGIANRSQRTAALGAPVFAAQKEKAVRGPGSAARHACRDASATSPGRAREVQSDAAIFGKATLLSRPGPPRPLESAAVAADASSDDWDEESPRAFESTLVATPRSAKSDKSVASSSRLQQLPDMGEVGSDGRGGCMRRGPGDASRAGGARVLLRQSRPNLDCGGEAVAAMAADAGAAAMRAGSGEHAPEITQVAGDKGSPAPGITAEEDAAGVSGLWHCDAQQDASNGADGREALAASKEAANARAPSEAGFSILDEVRTQYTESEAFSDKDEVDSSVDESDNERVEEERRQFFREAYCRRGSDSEDDLADLDQALEPRDMFEARYLAPPCRCDDRSPILSPWITRDLTMTGQWDSSSCLAGRLVRVRRVRRFFRRKMPVSGVPHTWGSGACVDADGGIVNGGACRHVPGTRCRKCTVFMVLWKLTALIGMDAHGRFPLVPRPRVARG